MGEVQNISLEKHVLTKSALNIFCSPQITTAEFKMVDESNPKILGALNRACAVRR